MKLKPAYLVLFLVHTLSSGCSAPTPIEVCGHLERMLSAAGVQNSREFQIEVGHCQEEMGRMQATDPDNYKAAAECITEVPVPARAQLAPCMPLVASYLDASYYLGTQIAAPAGEAPVTNARMDPRVVEPCAAECNGDMTCFGSCVERKAAEINARIAGGL